jgi:pimeloyl-ACP methyl ester carboxylesterase
VPHATVNGAELRYEDADEGPPVLLIHGTGGFMELWSETAEALAETHRVVRYDRRGFGGSAGARARKVTDHVDDAAALLDQLEIPSAAVLAWSGGGVIALGLAASHPERVSALTLAEPAVHMTTHPSLTTLRMLSRFEFARRIRRDDRAAALAMYHWASRYTTGGNAFDAYPAQWRTIMLDHASATVAEIDQLTRPYPSKQAIRSISSPVTCFVGDVADPVFARATRFLAAQLPQTRVVTIEGASHMLPTDRPHELAAAVRDALATREPAPSARGA